MNPVLVSYAALFVAIVFEVIGTSFLQQTNQWTRLTPTLCMGASYAVAFYLLSITLTTMHIGIASPLWSGKIGSGSGRERGRQYVKISVVAVTYTIKEDGRMLSD